MTTPQKLSLLTQVAVISNVNEILLNIAKTLPATQGRPITDIAVKLIECQQMINQIGAAIQPEETNPILN